jgi:hypothetical protein
MSNNIKIMSVSTQQAVNKEQGFQNLENGN